MVPHKIENVNNDFSLFTKRVAIYISYRGCCICIYIYIITIKTHIIKHHMSGCRNPDDLCSILLSLSRRHLFREPFAMWSFLSRHPCVWNTLSRAFAEHPEKNPPCSRANTYWNICSPPARWESLYYREYHTKLYRTIHIYIHTHYTDYTIIRNVSDTPNINLLKSRSTPRKKKHCDIPQQIHGIWPVSILTSGLLQLWSFTSYKS